MKNGVFLPVVGKAVYGQTFEEFPFAVEYALQGTDHQRFAETPRARDEEEGISGSDKLVKISRLVHVNDVLFPESREDVAAEIDHL